MSATNRVALLLSVLPVVSVGCRKAGATESATPTKSSTAPASLTSDVATPSGVSHRTVTAPIPGSRLRLETECVEDSRGARRIYRLGGHHIAVEEGELQGRCSGPRFSTYTPSAGVQRVCVKDGSDPVWWEVQVRNGVVSNVYSRLRDTCNSPPSPTPPAMCNGKRYPPGTAHEFDVEEFPPLGCRHGIPVPHRLAFDAARYDGILDPTNGCSDASIFSTSGQLSLDDFMQTRFRSACNGHDRCYSNTGKRRAQCDSEFYDAMREACRNNRRGQECQDRAWIYYEAVREFGDGPWRKTQKQARLFGKYARKMVSAAGCQPSPVQQYALDVGECFGGCYYSDWLIRTEDPASLQEHLQAKGCYEYQPGGT